MDTAMIGRALTERLESLDAELAELTAVPRDPVTAVSFGKRIGDGTTEAISRLTDIGVGRSLETGLERVERALAKLDEGTYGTCDGCGGPIAPKRLEAMPDSTLCVECAAAERRVPAPRR